MAVIIVTKKCYIIAEKIHHITVSEEINTDHIRPYNFWQIEIHLERCSTTGTNSQSRNETVSVNVGDRESAYRLFSEIVSQIREQIPDQLYLDKLISNFLGGEALDEKSATEQFKPSTRKVSRTRKKKRRR
jgi:hypothetical protein